MTNRLELPFGAFFRADERPIAFRDLLRRCLAQRSGLSAEMGRETVVVALETEQDSSGKLRLGGRWRAPDFRAGPGEELEAKLIMPLLFRISRIQLPYAQVYNIGRDHRPIADFFARNLFLAMARGAAVICEESADDGAAPTVGVHDFQRQYFYIMKAVFSENIFKERSVRDALDLVLMNGYLPVATFENPLLMRGTELLRQIGRAGRDGDAAVLKARLMDARKRMLACYRI